MLSAISALFFPLDISLSIDKSIESNPKLWTLDFELVLLTLLLPVLFNKTFFKELFTTKKLLYIHFIRVYPIIKKIRHNNQIIIQAR